MNIIEQLQSRIDSRSNLITRWEQAGGSKVSKRLALKGIREEQTLDKRLMARCIWDERLRVLYIKLLHKYSRVVAENVKLKGTFKEAREAE